ncbi:hypothetical protein M8J77_015664 [Diaphorina citri]|nr:hypothetical protein M8J77_015664 [Diaphorina citri]
MYKIKPKTSTSKNVASLTQRVSVGSSGHGPTTPSVNIRPSPRTTSGGSIAKRPSYSSALGSGTVCGCTSKSPNVTSTQTPGNRVDQLIEKLKILENEQKLLSAKIERVTAVLDQLSSSSNSSNECRRCTCPACSAPPAPIHGGVPARPLSSLPFKRVLIASDSIGRDLSFHLNRSLSGDTQVLSSVKSGARFGDVVASIPVACPDLSKDDAVIIIGGANDIPLLPPILPSASHGFSSRSLNFRPLAELSSRTNVIVCTVPYRYDHRANLSTNIYSTNQGILFRAQKYNILCFDLNKFLSRRHFTRHGLHLNRHGKVTLGRKLVSFLSDFESGCPASSNDNENATQDSTFNMSPIQRPPPPRSNLQSVPDLDSSVSDDCLPVSTVRLAAVPQECFNDVVSDTSVLNVSSLNDDLIHDLPACDASSPMKVDDLPVSDVSSPKQGDVSVPNREGGRSHDGATVSRSSLGSGAVGHDKPVKRRRKIAALDPIRRPFIPRRAKSNFRLQNRKQGKTS